jgi:hypothetical protein
LPGQVRGGHSALADTPLDFVTRDLHLHNYSGATAQNRSTLNRLLLPTIWGATCFSTRDRVE